LLSGVGLMWLAVQKQSFRFRWVYGAVLVVWLLAVGYWHVTEHDERRLPAHFARVCPDAAVFIGVVNDAPDKGGKVKIPLRIQAAAERPGQWRTCEGYLLLFFDPTPEVEALRYGDRIWVTARAMPTEPPRNPHAFDYQRYLHYRNLHYQAFVRDSSAFGLIDRGHGSWLRRTAYAWRERLLLVLREYFPTQDEYAVASALLLGYKEDLTEELRATYSQTGSMHALAVSGTHVGLVYVALYFLIRRIPWRGAWKRWGDTVLVLLGIWTFALITGASPSVMRASLMFTLFLVGKALFRHASTWNVLGATAFVLLLYNPYNLFDLGFQLSFAAVAGIVGILPVLQRYSPRRMPRWLQGPWDVLLVGIAAQLGTLPLSLYYFHQFPVYFWLAGWVVVLGGALYMWGAGALLVFHALVPQVADVLGAGLYYGLWGMNQLLRFIQHLPGSVVQGIWLSGLSVICLYGCIAYGAAGLFYKRPRWLITALAFLLFVSGERLIRQVGQLQQRQATLYSAGRNFLLDFFDGTALYTWSDSIPERRERFAAESHRSALGFLKPSERLQPSFSQPFRASNLLVQPPFVQFHDKTIAVVEHAQQLGNTAAMPVPVEALILRQNARVTLAECLRHFAPKVVVIDASNSLRRAQRWAAEGDTLGLAMHDLRQQGAWTLYAR
ncbi:MAG: ComEC family competence protein, partial [Saprospiraceae bacterium]|nr:ComEC family competence protein [Saprospiraceae bacterium]